jgi:hypothetical protein
VSFSRAEVDPSLASTWPVLGSDTCHMRAAGEMERRWGGDGEEMGRRWDGRSGGDPRTVTEPDLMRMAQSATSPADQRTCHIR